MNTERARSPVWEWAVNTLLFRRLALQFLTAVNQAVAVQKSKEATASFSVKQQLFTNVEELLRQIFESSNMKEVQYIQSSGSL